MPRLSFTIVGVTLPLSALAVPLFDVGSPEWIADLKDGILPKDKFCKTNADSIEALLKDPAGKAYCLNVLDLPKTTLTATVYAPGSQLPGVVAAATPGAGYPADPIPTSDVDYPADLIPTSGVGYAVDPIPSSARGYPVVPIPTSVRADPIVAVPTFTQGPSTLSTVTETDTITVDATVTEAVVETEITTVTSTTVEMLSCLTTATTIGIQAAGQTSAPVPAVGIPGLSDASSGEDPEKTSGYPVEDPKELSGYPVEGPKESSGYPVEVPDFRVEKRGHYDPKPACIPAIWTEKQIKRACECLELSAPSYTTTVTRVGPSPTAVAAAGKKPQGQSGGALGGLLGGVLRRVAPAAADNDAANCVTETTTATATRTVTQTTTASTVTRTETAVATGPATVAAAAAGSGAAYRRFTHPFEATAASGFGAAFFRDRKNPAAARGPFPAGLTFASSSAADAQMAVAGLAPFAVEQAALVVQGFFLAPETGPYTFSTPGGNIDNWGYLWLGEMAYRDWTDDNAAFRASRLEGTVTGGSKMMQLVAGEAVPLTWLWANAGGPGRSYLSVTMPDGTLVEDTSSLLVKACNDDVFQ